MRSLKVVLSFLLLALFMVSCAKMDQSELDDYYGAYSLVGSSFNNFNLYFELGVALPEQVNINAAGFESRQCPVDDKHISCSTVPAEEGALHGGFQRNKLFEGKIHGAGNAGGGGSGRSLGDAGHRNIIDESFDPSKNIFSLQYEGLFGKSFVLLAGELAYNCSPINTLAGEPTDSYSCSKRSDVILEGNGNVRWAGNPGHGN